MNKKDKYYKDIDLIRVLACIVVFLYHLNILKGGYLAVCIFFVLSGYLSCISALKKEKFSLKEYYYNRLLKIYLPLLVALFITISITSLIPKITFLNLKPEVTSILFGYNNFWQLCVNLDYFARHITSPFMHLWYIAILLQFELIFPFIYLILRKIGDKFNKIIPCIIIFLLSLLSIVYFCKMSLFGNIMVAYYSTFARIFSLLFGMLLGFIHSYYDLPIRKRIKSNSKYRIIFYSYLLVLILMFIFVSSSSSLFQMAIVITTLISCRLIDYGTINTKKGTTIFDKIIKFLSSISYEIYLCQYPVIFLFQYLDVNMYLKIPIIIILVLILSYIIHFCLDFKNKKHKILKNIISVIIFVISLHGIYIYLITEDHTEEMKKLEKQLNQNSEILKKRQEEYELKLKEENDDWTTIINSLENEEKEIKSIVNNLSVVGIGDSIMLGAISSLYDVFPNGYFDAQISRTAWMANDILEELKNKNILGDVIILSLGSNGDCDFSCKDEIMKTIGKRKTFWVNVTNDKEVNVNDSLLSFASKYDNLYIIDWNSVSSGHPEYFISDGIHLTEEGRKVYANTINNAIYEVYLNEYNEKKEEIIDKHTDYLKNKVTFYGNAMLLNVFDYISDESKNFNFVINKDFTYESLKEKIEKSLNNNSITHKIVFVFDNSIDLNLSQYQSLIKLCQGAEVYIVSTSSLVSNFTYENVKIIDFYEQLKEHSDYLMMDNIHLTDIGNKELGKVLNNFFS